MEESISDEIRMSGLSPKEIIFSKTPLSIWQTKINLLNYIIWK
jgi:hypothetical protein